VYIKRGRDNVSDKQEENKRITEALEDMVSTKSKIKDLIDKGVIDRVNRGLPVSHKDFKSLEDIKKEYDSYFDEDSGNTVKEGLEEVAEYLEEEITSLSRKKPSQDLNTPLEDESKKRKIDDSTDNKPSSSGTDLPVEMPSIFEDTD